MARITLYLFPDVLLEKIRWAEEVAKSARKVTIPVVDPYVLRIILEKAPRDDVEVRVIKGGKIYRLEKEKLLEYDAEDAFLNLDKIFSA